ncbi:MAG TPA: TenA family protein [Streptosporangiaceae bacterium]|nr:TenA family protein [Streptosporangiaceae bacterium]
MSDGFTGQLWQSIEGIYAAILAHPFLTGLTDGTLPPSAFAFYVRQDALYLRKYAEALALVSSRAPDEAGREMFARHAAGAIAVEQTLHGSLLAELGIDPAEVAVGRLSGQTSTATEPAPTTLAYTSYLCATAGAGSYAEGVSAVLPCYWIYWEVGKELLRRGSPDPRYQRWIATYGGEEFGGVVQEVLAVADQIGEDLPLPERVLATRHFRTSSRYEWMFWDMGYRQERWPV